MRDKSATLATQTTAIRPYFNTLITGHLQARKPGANRQRHLPDGMMSIGRDQQVGALVAGIEFVPHPYEAVPAVSIAEMIERLSSGQFKQCSGSPKIEGGTPAAREGVLSVAPFER